MEGQLHFSIFPVQCMFYYLQAVVSGQPVKDLSS